MIDFNFSVKLGPLRHENSKRYFDSRNDWRIWKWCRQFDLLTEGNHDIWLERVQQGHKTRMYEVMTNVKDKEFPEPVGVCGFTDIDHVNQRAEFSLYIFPEHHGFGYGMNALETLFKHGFQNLNFNRIWGESFDGNPAIKMFESLGMSKEGTRKDFYFREGKFIDAHLFSIGRKEWSRRSSPVSA